MTPQEFKAWFDGFTEAMDGRPSDKQWKRIKERVAEIDGASAVPLYIERYRPWLWNGPYWGGYCNTMVGGTSGATLNCAAPNSASFVVNGPHDPVLTMTATEIMLSAGRADAAELAA